MTNSLDKVEQNYTFTCLLFLLFYTNKTFAFCFKHHYDCIYGVNTYLMNQYKKKIILKRI